MDNDSTDSGHIEWGARIRRERERRSWSQADAVGHLRRMVLEQHGVALADDESLLRSWKRWERGAGIRPDNQRYLAQLFESVPGALFPARRHVELLPTGDVTELLQRLQASSVSQTAVDGLQLVVDRLCSEYPYLPAEQLLFEARMWLARLVQLTRQPMTLAQRTEVQVHGGWLALLVACVQHDLGDARSAAMTRAQALSLGHEAGHAAIQGWAHEIAAWQALTSGNVPGVLTAVEGGLAVAGQSGVAVQLVAQRAKALARLGEHRAALEALEHGRRLLDPLEHPTNVDHHFVVEPAKYDCYAMDVYRLSSEDDAADQLAREVLAAGTNPDGSERLVMRNAEARLTLGTVAARSGDIDGAVHWALSALAPDRRSLPSLLLVAGDLTAVINRVAPNAAITRGYLDRVRDLAAQT